MFTANKDVASGVKNLSIKESARDLMGEARDDLQDAAQNAGRKVRRFISSAADEVSDVSDKVTSQIRSNPVQSSLIALGAGILLGALLRR